MENCYENHLNSLVFANSETRNNININEINLSYKESLVSDSVPASFQPNNTCNIRPKKKPRVSSKFKGELCRVCGDNATGYHYKAITCEGCKVFFLRNVSEKTETSQCATGGNCKMDMYTRRKCKFCRFKKCLVVGMQPDCVSLDRNKNRKAANQFKGNSENRVVYLSTITKKAETLSTSSSFSSVKVSIPETNLSLSASREYLSKQKSLLKTSYPEKLKYPLLTPISNKNNHINNNSFKNSTAKLFVNKISKIIDSKFRDCMIKWLTLLQDQFELPSEEFVTALEEYLIQYDPLKADYLRMLHYGRLNMNLIRDFTESLPGFQELTKEDKINILKSSSYEVMLIKSSRRYVLHNDSMILANNKEFNRESFRNVFPGLADPTYNFCKGIAKLNINNAEYALLTAICVFSERPNLKQYQKIEAIQELYVDCLTSYIKDHRSGNCARIARLIDKLGALRELNNNHASSLFSMNVHLDEIPSVLVNIWDLNEYVKSFDNLNSVAANVSNSTNHHNLHSANHNNGEEDEEEEDRKVDVLGEYFTKAECKNSAYASREEADENYSDCLSEESRLKDRSASTSLPLHLKCENQGDPEIDCIYNKIYNGIIQNESSFEAIKSLENQKINIKNFSLYLYQRYVSKNYSSYQAYAPVLSRGVPPFQGDTAPNYAYDGDPSCVSRHSPSLIPHKRANDHQSEGGRNQERQFFPIFKYLTAFDSLYDECDEHECLLNKNGVRSSLRPSPSPSSPSLHGYCSDVQNES